MQQLRTPRRLCTAERAADVRRSAILPIGSAFDCESSIGRISGSCATELTFTFPTSIWLGRTSTCRPSSFTATRLPRSGHSFGRATVPTGTHAMVCVMEYDRNKVCHKAVRHRTLQP